MELTWESVGLVIGGAVAAWLVSQIQRILSRNIHLRSPSEAALENIIPTMNMMASTYGALLYGTKTLLEVTKGKCNGNVDESLEKINKAEVVYDKFLTSKLKVKDTK